MELQAEKTNVYAGELFFSFDLRNVRVCQGSSYSDSTRFMHIDKHPENNF